MNILNNSVLFTKLSTESKLYNELNKRCLNIEYGPEVLDTVHKVGEYSINKSKTILKYMPEYTLHDEVHFFNMIFIIEKILSQETIESLSIPDILLIFTSVFLHDIGMCPDENLIKAWKNQLSSTESKKYTKEIQAFSRFRKSYVKELEEIKILNSRGKTSKAQLIEDFIVSEYIRTTHATRARKIIARDWKNSIKYKETDLTADLASICFSHNESYKSLLNLETLKLCGQDVYTCIPFIAVLLRLADIIDFDSKRAPNTIYQHLSIRNPISKSEWQKHLAIKAWSISNQKLVYNAECSNPFIESTIRNFCDQIDDELRNCTLILSSLSSDYLENEIKKYKISLPNEVDKSKIRPARDIETGEYLYQYHDTKFTLSKKQVIDLLMGTKLYDKPEVALRELIQNSIDACLFRQLLSSQWNIPYNPEICIKLYTNDSRTILKVTDNGIGMNQYIIDNYYTRIGNSYYNSKDFYAEIGDTEYKPISRFGIGILSCFMICESMEVNTCRVKGKYQSDEPLKITIEDYDSLFVIRRGDRDEPGTSTKLVLKDQILWSKLDPENFVDSVKEMIPLPPFPIDIYSGDNHTIYDGQNYNSLDLSMKDSYTWDSLGKDSKSNIKIIDIDLESSKYGFQGKASIAIIENHGTPVENLDLVSKEIYIDSEQYSLSYSLNYGTGNIDKSSSQIEVNEDGDIESNTSYSKVARSESQLSIHGIDVPTNLFLDYTNYGEKAVLSYPFPMRIRINIGQPNDLNLNTARNKIIYDNKWLTFEKQLLDVICLELKCKYEKWDEFGKIINKSIKDPVLKDVIQSHLN